MVETSAAVPLAFAPGRRVSYCTESWTPPRAGVAALPRKQFTGGKKRPAGTIAEAFGDRACLSLKQEAKVADTLRPH